MGEFVHGCVGAVAHQHPDDKVSVTIEVQPGLPGIMADADQLERVLMNLLNNAYEALDGHGSIRVSAQLADVSNAESQVEIAITDNGPGMDKATLERAFIPFFTTKESGIGLGLALCEKLTRSQDGAIQIQSKPGSGTTVRVRLPSHRRDGAPATSAEGGTVA